MLRVMQHILICLLLKFHKILLFAMKVIHKKLRGLLIMAHRVQQLSHGKTCHFSFYSSFNNCRDIITVLH